MSKAAKKYIPYASRADLLQDLIIRALALIVGLGGAYLCLYIIGAVEYGDWFVGHEPSMFALRVIIVSASTLMGLCCIVLFISALVAGWGGDAPKETDDAADHE